MKRTMRCFLILTGLLFLIQVQFSQAKEEAVIGAIPTLGDYSSLSMVTGENKIHSPSTAPTDTQAITAYTSGANATNFSGTLTVDPTTGVLSVINAKPAGTYTVTVKATNLEGVSITGAFELNVTDPKSSTGVFGPKSDWGAGSFPTSVSIGDFNRDGDQDVVVANFGSNTVSLMLGQGTGYFVSHIEFEVGLNPSSLSIGDFNSDGKQDLAVTSLSSNTVSILLGDGMESFAPKIDFPTGIAPWSVSVGDFDQDGNQDLVVAIGSTNTVSVMLGDGKGSFGAGSEYEVGVFPRAIAVGDFNGDSKQDLAVANSDDVTVSILLGNGVGGFGPKTDLTIGARPTSVSIGDFNGDDVQDLAVAMGSANKVRVFLGDGLGAFVAKADLETGTNPSYSSVGDFNGDGKLDLVVTNQGSNRTSIFLGDGAGDFGSKADFATGVSSNSVAVGDFNGDGMQDLAVANGNTNTVSFLLALAPPTLGNYGSLTMNAGENKYHYVSRSPTNTKSISVFTSGAGATNFSGTLTGNPSTGAVSITNVKQAGIYTVTVQATSSEGVSVSRTFELTVTDPLRSNGTFGPKSDFDVGEAPNSIAVGDFNGDGHQDLAVVNGSSNSISILLGYGVGEFDAKTDYQVGSGPASVSIGDFNGDGKQDIAVVNNGESSVSIRLGNGTGGFGAVNSFSTGEFPRSVSVGDFNGDGKQDLAVTNLIENSVSILLGKGTGDFWPKNDFQTGTNPVFVTVGDFNGDGKQDVATANSRANTVSVLLGNGAGSFGTKTDFSTGSTPNAVSTGDFNGDEIQDLAVLNGGSNTVSILLGNGAGGFGTKTDFGTGTNPSSIAVGDFNGDGKLDLTVTNGISNTISILLGNNTGSFGPKIDFETNTGPRSIAVGDFNEDGRQDLAVVNLTSGNVSILLGIETPTLGNYSSLTMLTGDNRFHTPTAAPTNTESITAYTTGVNATDFTGAFVVDPVTGVVSVINAKQAGTYNVTVKATSKNGSATSTFDLIIGDPQESKGEFGPKTDFGDEFEDYFYPLESIEEGDFNGDGIQDLVATSSFTSNSISYLSVFLGDGRGGFDHDFVFTFDSYGTVEKVLVGDFNGDGKQDLVVQTNVVQFPLIILEGDGMGNFTEGAKINTGDNTARILAIGDFNGDGNQDLVMNRWPDLVGVFLGDGQGGFRELGLFQGNSGQLSLSVGDFNQDSWQDIVVVNNGSHSVSIYLGDGQGGFGAKTDFSVGQNPRSVSIGDFNEDGIQDLVVVSRVSNSVSILLGDGLGGFGTKADFGTAVSPQSVEVGDFNGDGKADLAVPCYNQYNPNLSIVSVLLGDGMGGFEAKTDYETVYGANHIAVGDYNRDGVQDLAVSTLDGKVSILNGLKILNTTVITLEDANFVYDGSPKSLKIKGVIPPGLTITYSNNSRTDVGTQVVTATLSYPGYSDSDLTANLTITPATITGITFEDASLAYDGTEKSLSITGELPEGTSVAYTNNGRTEVGTQEVTATITGDNFTELVLKANLTVLECTTEAAFNVSPEIGCASLLTVFFDDRSTDTDTWLWEFGDGSISSAQNPIHSYTSFGDFTVRLTASNSETGCSSILEKVISNQPLSADFTANTTFGCGPLTVDFQDESEGATTWAWDFGDGTTSTEQNPSHTYQSSGRFTVTLIVNRGSRCTDTRTISNYIQVIGPEVEFTSDETEGCGPLTVSFTDQTRASAPFISFAWDFGDGQTSNLQNPTHTYANAGIFTVSLTVRDLDGCSRTLTKADLIQVDALDFEFTDLNEVSCFDGSDGSVTVQVLDGTGPYTYLWSNEQTSATATGLKEGTYSVTVSDASGCQKTKEITISAPAQPILETDPANQITATTAVLGGSLSSGLDCVQEVGVVYGMTSDPTVSDTKVIMDLDGDSFNNTISDLVINTTYFVRSYSINQNGYISYGENQSFTTLQKVLEVKVEENQGKVFGETDPILRFTVSGFEGTDDKSILSGELKREEGEDVGFYPIRLGTLDAGPNYTIEFTGADFEIEPSTINGLTFEAQSFVFDGTEKSLAIQGTLPIGTAVAYTNNGRTDVGTQEVTATISGDNFTELVLKADLTITPAELEGITFGDKTFVYDGTEKSLSISGTLPEGASVTYLNNGRTNVGTQEVSARITGSNFTTLELTANLSISSAEIQAITFEDESFVYDGSEKSLLISGILPEGVSVAYTNNKRTEVGSQEVEARISGSNFNDLVLKAMLTITPGTIEGISFLDGSFTYDGSVKSLLVSGSIPEGVSIAYDNNSRIDVGTQEVTATLKGSNYSILILTADLTVKPANVAGLTFDDANFVFDGTEKSLSIGGTLPEGASVEYSNNGRTDVGTQVVSATISGNNFTSLKLTAELTITPANITGITFEDGDFVYDGSEKSLSISGSLPEGASVEYSNNKRTNVGTQYVTARITDTNYHPLELTAHLSITSSTVAGIIFFDGSFVYDGTSKSLAITGKLPSGTSVTYSNNNRTDVGTQEVTATIMGSNYTTLVLTADLEVTPATITGITLVGGSFTYNGLAKSLAISGTLPVGTTVNYANNSRKDVGTQVVTATIGGSNFTTLELKANLTITPATITGITFEDESFVFDGSAKSLAIFGALPQGTSVAYQNNSRTDVGTQEVTATISGSNFTKLVLTADLTITPADVEGITFGDQSFVFDGIEKNLAITGTLPTGTEVAYTNNSRTDVGTQEVIAIISGANFTTMELKADLTITASDLVVTVAPDQSKLFGQADPVLTYSASGYGAGDDESIFSGSLVRELGEAVGFYAINQGNLDAGLNYTINFTGATFEIITNDTDKDGVPDDVEKQDGTDPNDPMDYLDTDNDGVPDYVEEQQATDPTDPMDYKDSDGDKVPDYIEERDGTDPENVNDYKDVDGDQVPDYIEKIQGTGPTDPMDYRDEDGDAVPDYVEDVQGTDPTDAGDYVDTDGDDVPDYVEEQQGTDPNAETDFPDVDEDGIPDYVQARSVTEFVAQSLEVLWGTEPGDLKVPTEAVVVTAQGEFINLSVTWNLTGYDPMISGASTYTGMVELPAGIFNPSGLQPTLEITVLAKPAPQDVTLSANIFIGIPDQYFQEIGAFTVVDPTDNVHVLSLQEGVQDNNYFEVLDGILFWSSAEQAEGRTEFTVSLLVTDRAGNVLEKDFQITRERTPLDQLDVPNTFTPNGDGVNDTWGMPALRYYTGVRISVFAVGGDRLFYTEDADVQWDGVFNGKEMPVGAYLYVIEVGETGEIRRGMLNLIND